MTARMAVKRALRPRNFSLASAYPARELKNTRPTVTSRATHTELKNQRGNFVSSSRLIASLVTGFGIRFSGLLLASVWVLNEVTNWMMKGKMYMSANMTRST